jgi:protein-S-isoprenylcysteine O-methyltransferase Ste14
MGKIITSVVITGLMLYCPLIDKPGLMLDAKLVFPTVCSLWLLFKQKTLTWRAIRANAKTDGYSTVLIVLTGMVTQVLPIADWKSGAEACTCLGLAEYIGILMLFGGLYLRLKAIDELDRFFTNEVRIEEGWKLIKTGTYKYIRHGSYTGSFLTMLGTSVLFQSWLSLFFSFIILFIVYDYRIRLEEKMLVEFFGEEYLEYQKKTKKMIPFIY